MTTRSKARNSAKSRTKSQRGGGASEWQYTNLGSGWQQFMNTFSTTGHAGNTPSNDIVQNNPQKGGKRHRMHKRHGRSKKGGYWGAVLEQAAVPLALLGMQQAYGKRHTRRNGMSHKRTFKRRR